MIRVYKSKCKCMIKGTNFKRGKSYYSAFNDNGIRVYDPVKKMWYQFSYRRSCSFVSSGNQYNAHFEKELMYRDFSCKKELNAFINKLDNN